MKKLGERKNILIVVVDCLGAPRLEKKMQSAALPNFNYLRDNSITFNDIVTVCTHTSPSFASLITGYYPPSHGLVALRNYKLNPQVMTMPELFRQAGYRTRAWVTGPLLSLLGLDRGWNVYEYRDRKHDLWSDTGRQYLSWLQNNRAKGPWLVMLHLWELHKPRKILAEFDDAQFGDNAYDRALHTVDELLGTLLASVDKETTYMLVLGDHGENVNWYDYKSPIHKIRHVLKVLRWKRSLSAIRNGHGFHLYEDMIRIPLFIAGPGLPTGKMSKRPGSTIDILPTCAYLAGFAEEKLPAWDGVNLLGVAPVNKTRPILVMTSEGSDKWPSIKCVRMPPWKYWETQQSKVMRKSLFNLKEDPHEQLNLIKRHPNRSFAMQKELARILQQSAPFPAAVYTKQEEAELRKKLKDLGYM